MNMQIEQCRDDAVRILTMVAEKFPSECQLDFYEMAGETNPHNPQGLPHKVRWYFDLARYLVEEGYLRSTVLREHYGSGSLRITSRGLALLGKRLFDEPER